MSTVLGIAGAALMLAGICFIYTARRLQRVCTLPILAHVVRLGRRAGDNNAPIYEYSVGSKALRGRSAGTEMQLTRQVGDEVKLMVNPENPAEFIAQQRKSIPWRGIILLLLGGVMIAAALLLR